MRNACAILLLLALGACNGEPDLTGVWHTEEGETVAWGGAQDFEGRIEFVLGHYGRDVAGLLRLYEADGSFVAANLHSTCKCRFLLDGSFQGETLVFSVQGCQVAGEEGGSWSGTFHYVEEDEDEILVGRISLKPGGTEKTMEFRLLKTGDEDTIREEQLNLECEESDN